MLTSAKGIKLIQSFEGCRLKAYQDCVNVWTIGYGHTGKVNGKSIGKGMKISKIMATDLLKVDLAKFENAVNNIVKIKLTQHQFDALVSFSYNCGAGNLKKLVAGRTTDEIAEHIILYDKAGGKAIKGLTRRRKAEQDLFLM